VKIAVRKPFRAKVVVRKSVQGKVVVENPFQAKVGEQLSAAKAVVVRPFRVKVVEQVAELVRGHQHQQVIAPAAQKWVATENSTAQGRQQTSPCCLQ
jgi:hypothetical protein